MRVYLVVEGQTEERFANALLVPHLASVGVWLYPFIVTTSRERRTGRKTGRGGGTWNVWRKDLTQLLRSKPGTDVRVTTLFDLYHLPRDFPDLEQLAQIQDTRTRADKLCATMAGELGDDRLLPYLQVHEFEAFLFTDLQHLRDLLDDPTDIAALEKLAASVGEQAPEDIDDGDDTAPSRRLIGHLGSSYQKTVHGPLVTESIGLPGIRAACPRFDAWVSSLESLAPVVQD